MSTNIAREKKDPNERKSAHVDEDGPRSGFSASGWNENLLRDFRMQSPCDFLGQSLTSMVTRKVTRWRTTNRDMTQVFSFLGWREPKKGIFSLGDSMGGWFLMSGNSTSMSRWFLIASAMILLKEGWAVGLQEKMVGIIFGSSSTQESAGSCCKSDKKSIFSMFICFSFV